MKFVISGYEIDIKAKREYDDRNSKDAALCFMNMVAIWMREAGHYTAFEGRNDDGYYDGDTEAIECGKRCGKMQIEESFSLHDQLDAYGCYDDIR